MSQPLDVVQSHDRPPRGWRPEPGPRLLRALRAIGLVAIAVVVAGLVWNGVHDGRVPRCGVQGHAEWCRTPSRQMTDPALVRVVRTYCPGLDRSSDGRPVPQPMRLQHLADGPTRSIDTGSPGTEDALLGSARVFAEVTLWRGGRYDGRVDVRCSGVPVLELTRDQVASTMSALGDVTHRSIDFAGLGEAAARRVDPDRSTSPGTFSCRTLGMDLRSLRAGQRFECRIEVFRLMGKGVYPLPYVVTRSTPYVEDVSAARAPRRSPPRARGR